MPPAAIRMATSANAMSRKPTPSRCCSTSPPEKNRTSRSSATTIPPRTAPASATIFMSPISPMPMSRHCARYATALLQTPRSTSAPAAARRCANWSTPSATSPNAPCPSRSGRAAPATRHGSSPTPRARASGSAGIHVTATSPLRSRMPGLGAKAWAENGSAYTETELLVRFDQVSDVPSNHAVGRIEPVLHRFHDAGDSQGLSRSVRRYDCRRRNESGVNIGALAPVLQQRLLVIVGIDNMRQFIDHILDDWVLWLRTG